jgi:hypothetical protein
VALRDAGSSPSSLESEPREKPGLPDRRRGDLDFLSRHNSATGEILNCHCGLDGVQRI